MYKKNKLIRNTLSGMFFLTTLLLLPGCVFTLVEAALQLGQTIADEDHGAPGTWSVLPTCQLECVTTDKGLTEAISTTGLSRYWVEACFASNWGSKLTDVQYCEKSLNQFCERAVEKLEKENPLYSQCKVLETSECVRLGDGRFSECKGTVWSPQGKRSS